MKKESIKRGKKDPLRVIKEHFPGEDSSLRSLIHRLKPGAVDTIELKVSAPCLDSPEHEDDRPGYTTFQINLYKDQAKVAEQTRTVENESMLKQLIEECVYSYGCGQRTKINIVIDCEAAVFPAYSVTNLNKN
ncbi:MAG: hypothetical protein AABW48_04150 [Nanoarchaeota archaeon]